MDRWIKGGMRIDGAVIKNKNEGQKGLIRCGDQEDEQTLDRKIERSGGENEIKIPSMYQIIMPRARYINFHYR